jgi:phage gpG-like protein
MPRRRRDQATRIKIIGGEMTFSMSDPAFVEWTRPLDHFGEAARSFTPVFEEFAGYHRRAILRNFAAEGRPRRWPPLAETTIRDRERQGYGPGPILVRSGRMKRGFWFSFGKGTYRVGNHMHYFPHHQFGAPRANIPRRAMIVLLQQDKAMFTKIARKHLMRAK